MNKVRLILLSLLLTSGCNQPKPAKTVMLSDLKLGMQIFEVREIHNKDLTPIASESRQGYDLVQYRGWFNDGTTGKVWPCPVCPEEVTYPLLPYKLTFELYPPITKIQCQYIAAKNNITDPNELSKLYSLIGFRSSKLIEFTLDEASLQRAEIDRHNDLMIKQKQQNAYSSGILQPNAYGPGVHMNRYGQPVKLKPDFGGVQGEMLQIKPDAYGPGVHMDQYGRPVREYPWP